MKNLNTKRTGRKKDNAPSRSTLITDCFDKNVHCFFQIDGYDRRWKDDFLHVDKNGHGALCGIQYDLRRNDFPVRVQILEGTEKETALELLKIALKFVKNSYVDAFNPSKFDGTEDDLPF